MSSALDRLNDWLFRAAPTDQIFFVRYPPNTNEFTVTASDLTTGIHPAPLPTPPPEPPPAPLPPPTIPIDTLVVVNASAGLSIRAAPSPTATKRGTLQNGDLVEAQGSTVGGAYHYALLLRVNGLKYAEIGYVAREYLAPKV